MHAQIFGFHAGRIVSEKRVDPTKETKSRLSPGVFRILEDRGFLDRAHTLAAFAIEEGFNALTHGARPRLMGWKHDGIDRVPHWQVGAFQGKQAELIEQYKAWAEELDNTLNYNVCMDIIAGERLGVVEKRYGLRFGKGKGYLRDGLEVYCHQVGWL